MKRIPWEVDVFVFSDAYVAGFFDGDGSLVATLEKQTAKYRRTYRPRIKLNFTQHLKHRDVLEKLREYLRAGIVRISVSHDLAELVIVDRVAVKRILEAMLPHLVIKKKQAVLALEVIRSLGKNERTNRISDDMYKNIIEKIGLIRSLNSGTGGKEQKIFDPVTTSRISEGVAEMSL